MVRVWLSTCTRFVIEVILDLESLLPSVIAAIRHCQPMTSCSRRTRTKADKYIEVSDLMEVVKQFAKDCLNQCCSWL